MLEYRVRLLLTTAALLAAAAPAALAAGTTERVSVSSTGVQGNGDSGDNGLEAVSPDGRFVAFDSAASNLVKSDTNGKYDVFVRDLQAGTTERVSVSSSGAQATGASFGSLDPSISAHGHFVAFFSDATDLVPGDTNGATDIFVRDRAKGTTERVSVGPHGRQANGDSSDPSISADGRFVAFASDATDLVPGGTGIPGQIYVHDRRTGRTELVSVGPRGHQGNDISSFPSISADGRFVAFASFASNLVKGDTNGRGVFTGGDIFVRDRTKGTTERVSVSSDGAQANGDSPGLALAISANGLFVAFDSKATNLVPGDTNGATDIFVRDRAKGTTERVSVGPHGRQANGDSGVVGAAISADGRFVVFPSDATDLVEGSRGGGLYVRDRQAGTTERVDLGPHGVPGNGSSDRPAISAGGRVVAFDSDATNLVPGDTNGKLDVFVRAGLATAATAETAAR